MGLRILLIGDAGCASGFARANHGLGDRLIRNHGHEVYALATNYRGDDFDTPMHLYVPTMLDRSDTFGKSRIVEIMGKVEPDVVWMTNDPQVLLSLIFNNDEFDPKRILLYYRPLVTYQARDGSHPPKTWDALNSVPGPRGETFTVSRQVAMTKWGQQQMPGSDLVYHGVDSEVFHPATSANPIIRKNGNRITSRREAKESLGYPTDSFLVLRVDRNDWRKDYGSTIKALVPLFRKYKDIYAHFHCTTFPAAGGLHMFPALSRFEVPFGRVKFPDMSEKSTWDGWDTNDLVTLYNAADVLVSTSMGEGFGFAQAESLACGTPVIAQKISAITEVVGPGGILIEPGYEVMAPQGHDLYAADVPAFTEAIEHLYLNAGFRKRYAKAGREHVIKTFNWDEQAAIFSRILEETVAETPLMPVEATT